MSAMCRPNFPAIVAARAPAAAPGTASPPTSSAVPAGSRRKVSADSVWPISLHVLASGAGLIPEVAKHLVARNAQIVLPELRSAEHGFAHAPRCPDRIGDRTP